ncbi:tyrosine-type recombinase/integrase [Pseudomonas oryzihabitans]|uniref:tyrosine-type recombinase/integrase n=1 Tax=Pseudomonas oryzihabitans TaxID=47885 RepID=UPI00119E2095|nr:tyrosine-type recombinase/integrase [Pseudomonas oryzihabitans]
MSSQQPPRNGTNLLQTVLAKPYQYRRFGRYYLRIRPQGASIGFFSLSLRTTDRATAMTISKEILQTLRIYHLDNPAATWDELRERLEDIAESCLTMAHTDSSLVAYEMIHDEHYQALSEASAKLPLTSDQQRAIAKALEILEAAQERLQGRPERLVGVVGSLRKNDQVCSTPTPLSVSLSVNAQAVTFESLAKLYIQERADYVQASTMRDVKSSCAALAAVFGELDLKGHTRGDMVACRDKLLEGYSGSTVKKLWTRLSTVMEWAVNNDYLDKSFDKGLKPTRNADSSRKEFSTAQIADLMAYANGLTGDDWKRWGLSIGVLTGARIEEVRQLTKGDIKQVEGHWVIDINRDNGKALKTKNAIRLVPLIDGAHGFDLQAFLEYTQQSTGPLFALSSGRFSEVLNGTLRSVLELPTDRTQTFHSLRHSLAGSLKAAGVPVEAAQEILGHSSGSISYDLYGAGSGVRVEILAEALMKALNADTRYA